MNRIYNINLQSGINFIDNSVIINSQPLIIDKYVEIVGDNLTIYGDINIKCSSNFANITFENCVISVIESCSVEFTNCTFKPDSNRSCIVLLENSNSSLSIYRCIFFKSNSAIVAFNNKIDAILYSSFEFCETAVEISTEKYINQISNNIIFNHRNSSLIKFLSFSSSFKDMLEICRILTKLNNNSSVLCLKDSLPLINTASFYVKTKDELIETINSAINGAIIYLESGTYSGDIIINKSISIIGDEDTEIIPSEENKNMAAFIIEADYIVISKVKITSLGILKFRDGIKFSNVGGHNSLFLNLNIKDIRRRGISIFGKETYKTSIVKCTFKNIQNAAAIYLWKDILIDKCNFEDCGTALIMNSNFNLIMTNNKFKKINTLMRIKDYNIEVIKLRDNIYSRVEKFVDILI